MRSSSPRNCARHDSHPCARAGAIAVKHPARAPREILQKRTPPQTRARNYLNARMCSLRCELVTAQRITQEISLVAICPPHWQLCDEGRPLLVPSFAPRCDSRLERNMMISSRAFRCCLRTDALRPFSVFEVSIFIGEDKVPTKLSKMTPTIEDHPGRAAREAARHGRADDVRT